MSENIRKELLSDLQELKRLEAENEQYQSQSQQQFFFPSTVSFGAPEGYLRSSQYLTYGSNPSFANSQFLQPQAIPIPQTQNFSNFSGFQPNVVGLQPNVAGFQTNFSGFQPKVSGFQRGGVPIQSGFRQAPAYPSGVYQVGALPTQQNLIYSNVQAGAALAESQIAVQQQPLRESIKGESYFEYVPFEKVFYEQEERKKTDYVNVTKNKKDYYAVEKQVEYVPYTKYETIQEVVPQQRTEYLAQNYIDYVPQVTNEMIPVERVEEKVEYQPVSRKIVHYPQFDRQFLEQAENSGRIIQDADLAGNQLLASNPAGVYSSQVFSGAPVAQNFGFSTQSVLPKTSPIFQSQSQVFQSQRPVFQPQPQVFQPQPQVFKPQPQVFQSQSQVFQSNRPVFQPQIATTGLNYVGLGPRHMYQSVAPRAVYGGVAPNLVNNPYLAGGNVGGPMNQDSSAFRSQHIRSFGPSLITNSGIKNSISLKKKKKVQ